MRSGARYASSVHLLGSLDPPGGLFVLQLGFLFKNVPTLDSDPDSLALASFPNRMIGGTISTERPAVLPGAPGKFF